MSDKLLHLLKDGEMGRNVAEGKKKLKDIRIACHCEHSEAIFWINEYNFE